MCWKLVAAAPAADAVVEEAAVAAELPAAEVAEAVLAADEVEVDAAEYSAGSRVPQLSWMEVVQFFWPSASPTLASLQSVKACWQTYCVWYGKSIAETNAGLV